MAIRTERDRAAVAPRRSRAHFRRRRLIAGVLAVVVCWLAWSLGSAMTGPGNSSAVARLAEWARNNNMGFAVTGLERLQYNLSPPKTGGRPGTGLPTSVAAGNAAGAGSGAAAGKAAPAGTPAPAPLTPLASPALPGEGSWHTAVTVNGRPALRLAYLRPDSVHTSYVSGVAWMDPRLLSFQLHPGTIDPGGTGWTQASSIPTAQRAGLVAAFNSGFRFNSSYGGWYTDGRTVRPLVAGAASFVIYKNGTATVGAWGTEVKMTPNVVSVRQNLAPLVTAGAPAANINNSSSPQWGYTLGNAYYVWRSGVGVTRTGALVYVAGAALTTTSLAHLLVDAGAVRAMELDINPYWTNFFYYTHPQPAAPTIVVPHKLTADEQRKATRYFSATTRDFFTVYAR